MWIAQSHPMISQQPIQWFFQGTHTFQILIFFLNYVKLKRKQGAEASILLSPDGKSRLIGKDPDAGKDWGQEEKQMTKDEMIGWHHWLSGHEFEQTRGDNEEQGSLACCSPGVAKGWTWLSDWKITTKLHNYSFPGGSVAKNAEFTCLLWMQEMWIQLLGQLNVPKCPQGHFLSPGNDHLL